jgi:hypothetical protein
MMDPVTVWLGESQLDAPGPALAQDLLGFGAGEANVIALEYRARVAMRLDMSEEVVRRWCRESKRSIDIDLLRTVLRKNVQSKRRVVSQAQQPQGPTPPLRSAAGRASSRGPFRRGVRRGCPFPSLCPCAGRRSYRPS